jgi:hypothetical protein
VRRLPRTTPPFPNETLGSYVDRLAATNYLDTSEFRDHLHDPRTRQQGVSPARLAVACGWPLPTLRLALPELRSTPELPADLDHHQPAAACRLCTAAHGITGTVTCWAPPHRNVCLRHRRWIGHVEHVLHGLLDGRDPQLDLAALPEIVAAERHQRNLTRRHGQRPVILAYRTGLRIALRWAERNDWGRHRHRRIEAFGFVPATDWTFPSWDPMLRAAVYPEAVAVTSLVLSVYWVRIAATPRERWRFYAEAARRLRLPAYRPDTANDPLVRWADRHAAFELQWLTGEIDALVDSMRGSVGDSALTASNRHYARMPQIG